MVEEEGEGPEVGSPAEETWGHFALRVLVQAYSGLGAGAPVAPQIHARVVKYLRYLASLHHICWRVAFSLALGGPRPYRRRSYPEFFSESEKEGSSEEEPWQ